MINALSSMKQVEGFDRKEMEAKGENTVYRQSQKLAAYHDDRQSIAEEKFTSGQEYLVWFKQTIQCFEPFPSGDVIHEFRRWEKGLRRQSLITVEEGSEEIKDPGKGKPLIKWINAEQIDAGQNPVVRQRIQTWEAFEDEKQSVWFGEEAKMGQACEPTENWFPVDWGQEVKEEEEEKELFEERKHTKTTKRKWYSRKFLRPKNIKQRTFGLFSRLLNRLFH